VRDLEAVGEETLVLTFNKVTKSFNQLGTDPGLAFYNKRPDVGASFMAFVGGMTKT